MSQNRENHTPNRVVRVPDETWVKARDKAKRSGTTLSALINVWLKVYTQRD